MRSHCGGSRGGGPTAPQPRRRSTDTGEHRDAARRGIWTGGAGQTLSTQGVQRHDNNRITDDPPVQGGDGPQRPDVPDRRVRPRHHGAPTLAWCILPWIGMMGISSSEYAFASAEDTLHDAHGWNSLHIFWIMGVWVFFQAGVALPVGQLRESGKLPGALAMMWGAVGTFLGYLSLAYAPNSIVAYIGFGMFSGMGAGAGLRDLREHGRQVVSGAEGRQDRLRQRRFRLRLGALRVHLHRVHGPAQLQVGAGDRGCVSLALVVAVAGWFFKDPPKNWWPRARRPAEDDRTTRGRAGPGEEPAGGQAVHPAGRPPGPAVCR